MRADDLRAVLLVKAVDEAIGRVADAVLAADAMLDDNTAAALRFVDRGLQTDAQQDEGSDEMKAVTLRKSGRFLTRSFDGCDRV